MFESRFRLKIHSRNAPQRGKKKRGGGRRKENYKAGQRRKEEVQLSDSVPFFLFPPPPSLFRRTEKESCKVAGGEGKRKGPVVAAEGGRAVPEGSVAQHKAGKKLDAPLQAPFPPPPRPPCILKDTLKNGKSKSQGDDQVFRLQSYLSL